MILRICLLGLILGQCTARNSYIILTPKVIRPGLVENITVTILKSNIDNATIKATLEDLHSNILSESRGTFQSHAPKALQLKIPGDLKNLTPNTRSYRIRLQGTSGLSFMNATDVFVQSQNISIFIQTDKGTYKAGQKIQIRTFALFPNSSIYTGNFTLDIQDPKANIIKHWSNLNNTSYGVVSKSLDLDSQPVLGNWVIKVTAQGVTERATVKVDEYVLPKFNLETSFPQSAQVSDREVSGSVVATYTYGRPVPGRVNISVTIPSLSGSFKTWSGQMFTDSRHVTKEEKFTIPLGHLRDHILHGDRVSDHVDGAQLKVDVQFTEDNTDKTVSKTSYIRLQNHGTRFSLSHKGSNRYIPGFDVPVKIIFTDNEGREPNKHLHPAHLVVNSRNSSGSYTEQDKHIPIPSNGLVEIDLPTPNKTEVRTLEIKVTHDNVVKTLTLNAYDSSQTHIKLRVLSADHTVGKLVTLQIQANKPISEVYYQFVSRGLQVLSGRHDVNGRINATFNVHLTEEMTPETSVLVYNVDSDTGNIYADQASISVNGLLRNSVSVMFGQTQVEPGDKVNLNLQTAPHSMVYLSAIDTSSILMGNDNDITEQSLINGMEQYKPSIQEQLYFYKMTCGSYSAVKVDHDDTYSAYRFEEAGTMIVTDVQNYVPASYKYHPYYDLAAVWQSWHHSCGECCGLVSTTTTPPPTTTTRRYPFMALTAAPGFPLSPGSVFTGFVAPSPAPGMTYAPAMFTPVTANFGKPITNIYSTIYLGFQTTTPSLPGHLATAKHVRSKFPETWLWTSQFVGDSGNATISSIAPDSITSWVASAFSMNKDVGIGVSSAASKLNVFRPFFINVNLPFSVIHGEELVLQVNIFNYMTENLTVLVTLEQNSDFKNIVVDNLGYTHYESITKTTNVQVPSGQSESAFFPIIPNIIGDIDISVKAQSVIAADAVKRKLRVEAEGVKKEYNVPLIIDMTNKTTDHHSVPIEFPSSLVKGSERVQVLTIGDYMGPSVSGLDKLLTLPTGCGEQTMIGFAPDVSIFNYLQKTGQLTDQIKDKALSFMEKGYQRELKFQHRDGSFSVWGTKDYYGSTWLTAFVLKSFAQSASYIDINSEVLEKAQQWLINRQMSWGSFSELQGVNSLSLQGGSHKQLTLTAFVTIALIESKDVVSNTRLGNVLLKSNGYLEQHAKYLRDPYDIAIVGYALQLTGSSMAAEVMKKLEPQPSSAITTTTTAKPSCNEPAADIVFVLDSSGSIGSSNFQSILTFVRDMTSSFDFGNGKTKVSVVTFSSSVYEAFPLNAYNTAAAIGDAVSRVPYYSGGTDTASALRYVEHSSFIASKGARTNSSRIVIVITDGQSNDPSATKVAAEALRSIGVTTYSIGIGSGIGQRELENIASDINHVFRVSNYNALQQVQLSLGAENCQVVDIHLPWESSGKSPNYLWNSPNTRATPVDIETSAYTLLYYTKSQQYVQAQKILKWILKQRNANGGFASTQDTVLALQALSELTHSPSGDPLLDLHVNVNTHNESQMFNVNERNKMVLQKFQPSGVPEVVNVTASGHGVALVQVAVNYNVKEQIEKPAFLIDVTSLKETMETITTKICTRYNTSTALGSGMAIVEYGVPSGFEADMESISFHQNLKKSELDERNVVLYFDEITQNEACITINLERSTMVANIKPSPVRVYEYYNPEHQVTTFYTPSILKQTSYCDVCPTCPCGTKTN